MNKKAVVFSFIVIVLISVILIAFLVNLSNKNIQSKIQDVNIRIETINSFTRNLNDDLIPQAIKSSSNQAVLSWLDYLDHSNNVTTTLTPLTGEFITSSVSLNDNLKNAVVFGNYDKNLLIGGGLIELKHMYDGSTNYTFPSILEEIQILAFNSGLNFTYDDPQNYEYQITQISPWEISISVRITNYKLSDMKGEVFWNFEDRVYYTVLNVTNFVDPFMLVLDNKTININSTGFIPGPAGTFTDQNFRLFYTRPEFIAHNDAPSFLKRLKGDPSSDANGIETVLDPNYFRNTDGYSNVDYRYWTHADGCLLVHPENTYLDADHILYYNRQTSEPGCFSVK